MQPHLGTVHRQHVEALLRQVDFPPGRSQDEQDALLCALVAYLFVRRPAALLAPPQDFSWRGGWIWTPKDIFPEGT